MIALGEARAYVLARLPAPSPGTLALADALGTVLAEPLVAEEPVPSFDNTAMDGFAVRASDVATATDEHPVRLRVVDTLAAGHAIDRYVGPGETVRIMTGAPMPPGTDAVVMVERSTPVDRGTGVHERLDLG